MAFSMIPLASISAARQSLNPALVRSRNSFTSWAGICTAGCCVLILLYPCSLKSCCNPLLAERPAPEPSEAGHWNLPPTQPACGRQFSSVPLRPEEQWFLRLPPAFRPCPPRSRLPAFHTVRTRWYPRIRHLQPTPDPRRTSAPLP